MNDITTGTKPKNVKVTKKMQDATKKEVTPTDTCTKRSPKLQKMMDDTDTIECEPKIVNESDLLKEIHKSAKMGIDGINAVNTVLEDKILSKLLARQLRSYENISLETNNRAQTLGINLKSTSPMAKAMLWSGVMFNTLTDKSSSKIAEIMIQGINMGIISMTKALNAIDCDVDTTIADKLIALYTKHLDALKAYL